MPNYYYKKSRAMSHPITPSRYNYLKKYLDPKPVSEYQIQNQTHKLLISKTGDYTIITTYEKSKPICVFKTPKKAATLCWLVHLASISPSQTQPRT